MARQPRTLGPGDGGTLAASIASNAVVFPEGFSAAKSHRQQTSFTTTRNAVYRDKKISVRTTYKIEIDDQPLMVHTKVLDDGTVYCHGLTYHPYSSALDMTRAIIDGSARIAKPRDEIGDAARARKGGHK